MSQELKLKYYLDQKPLSNADIENMKKSKKKFVDELFPPNEISLFGEKYSHKAFKFLEDLKYKPTWERISNMPVLKKFMTKKIFHLIIYFKEV